MRAVGFMKYGGPEALEIYNLPEIHAGPGVDFQRRRQRSRVTVLEGAIQIVITPHHRGSIVQRDPT